MIHKRGPWFLSLSHEQSPSLCFACTFVPSTVSSDVFKKNSPSNMCLKGRKSSQFTKSSNSWSADYPQKYNGRSTDHMQTDLITVAAAIFLIYQIHKMFSVKRILVWIIEQNYKLLTKYFYLSYLLVFLYWKLARGILDWLPSTIPYNLAICYPYLILNSLALVGCGSDSKSVIFENTFYEISSGALLVKLLLGECQSKPLIISLHGSGNAWYMYFQATSHYLSQCWPRSMSPYGVTRPQWIKWIAVIQHRQDNQLSHNHLPRSGLSSQGRDCKNNLPIITVPRQDQ